MSIQAVRLFTRRLFGDPALLREVRGIVKSSDDRSAAAEAVSAIAARSGFHFTGSELEEAWGGAVSRDEVSDAELVALVGAPEPLEAG